MSGWISVDTILPQENIDVLVYMTENKGESDFLMWGNIFRAYWNFNNGTEEYDGKPQWVIYCGEDDLKNISTDIDKSCGVKPTHWMPLPKPPEIEND